MLHFCITAEAPYQDIDLDGLVEDLEFFLGVSGAFEVDSPNKLQSTEQFGYWPDHDEDMAEVSRMHPEVRLVLSGTNEDGTPFEKVYEGGLLTEEVGTCV